MLADIVLPATDSERRVHVVHELDEDRMGQELHAAVTDMPEIVDMSYADPKTWHGLPRDGQVYLAEEVGFPSLFSGRTRPF